MPTTYCSTGSIDTTTPCGCEAVALAYTAAHEGWPTKAERREQPIELWTVRCTTCDTWAKASVTFRPTRRTEVSGTWRSNWTELVPAPFVTWHTMDFSEQLGRTDATHALKAA